MSRTVGVPWRHTRTRGDDRETMSEMDALDVFCARVANDEEPAWRLVVKMLRRADRPQGADEDASAAVRGIAASLIPIADALSERLRPALGKDSKSLRTFETYFDGVTFLKGQSLTFSADGGKLTTSIRGKRVGVIDDAEMCVALFDAYLGKNPVVPGAKKSLGEKLAAHVVG